MAERSKAHDWKSCLRHKRNGSSNLLPSVSIIHVMLKVKDFLDKVCKLAVVRGLSAFFVRYSELGISNVAAAMTYYVFLAIFPFLIFLVSVSAFIGQRFSLSGDLAAFGTLLPETVAVYLRPLLKQIVQNSQLSTFSISALSILWASSSGFDTFLLSLEQIYRVPPLAFWLKKLCGIVFIIIMTLAISLSLISISFGSILLNELYKLTNLTIFNSQAFHYLRFAMPFLFVCLMLSAVYYFGCKRKGRYFQAFVAAVIPTVTWVLLSLTLSWYIDNFTKYNVIYGALAGIIVMMFWLYLLMQLVFVGALLHHFMLEAADNSKKCNSSELAEMVELKKNSRNGNAKI